MTAPRPNFIRHYTELREEDNSTYPGDSERMSIGAPVGRALGLTRIGVHHEDLPPGRRTSWPHAESDEEEFVFVIEGTPDVWVDGALHRLAPGDSVAFPAGTGIAHTVINNSGDHVRLLVLGEATKPSNRCVYPLHPQRNREIGELHWEDAPPRELGAHDGVPDAPEEV